VRAYFEAGGPLMLAILAAWVVVLAAMLDRLVYLVGRVRRRPLATVARLARSGEVVAARRALDDERARAARRLERIDAFSQLATSLGLFGTVVGITQSFFARAGELAMSAPEVLASGLSVALITTIGGLIVFLFGQLFLIAWREGQEFLERDLERELEALERARAEPAS
jgi:biopolymer transport protein ExbB/TolQ